MVLSVLLHDTIGLMVLSVTVAMHVLVQLLAVLVTVTVYIPADKLLMPDVVAPVLHRYVALVALVLTEADPLGFKQLVLATGVHAAVGGVTVLPTIA